MPSQYRPLPVLDGGVGGVCVECVHYRCNYNAEGCFIHRCDFLGKRNPVTGRPSGERCDDRNGEGQCRVWVPIPPKRGWLRRMFGGGK